ncbi:MAG: capsule biosynthesis protein [Sphingomicrobium sp.]
MTRVNAATQWIRNARNRRLAYLVMAIVAAVLVFFPQPYLARAKIVPQDTSATAASTTSLLGALGSSSQGIGSLLTGGRPPNDLYLIIGRSDSVAADVIKDLRLVGANASFPTDREAMIYLDKHVDVHLLLGGVMEIETKLYDRSEARRLTAAYARAISRQLARFGRQIIENKQRIVHERFEDSGRRVSEAEAILDGFRRANNLAEPEQQLSAELVQRATLEAQLKAKMVELQTLSQFRGPESNELKSIRSDIAGLQAQVARTATPSTTAAGPNVSRLSDLSLHYLQLFRNLKFQQSIYDIYQRSGEQVEVEQLASESASYIQIIDAAYVDPHRQHNVWAIALLAGIILLAMFTEWYAPATGLIDRAGRKVETTALEYAE